MGANVLYRLNNGTLTPDPLWDPATGTFGACGAIVAGINDVPDASCADVQTRLHVGTSDCPFPRDCGAAGSSGAGGGSGGGSGTAGGDSTESPRFYDARCGCASTDFGLVVLALLFLRQRRRDHPSRGL